ncbi:MAG: ParB/RepB/Spo0J family partition protein [Caldilineaceae bacterium]
MSTSTNRRRGLGRGLGALIVDTTSPEAEASTDSLPPSGIQSCPLAAIRPNPHQPRTQFDEETLQELTASIRVHGIIQPLIVTANPTEPHTYWLVAGERRWRAARLAALQEVPIIVREASPQQLVEWALIENVQRADLNPIEEGTAYQTLINDFGLTHAEIAERVGKSRSAITNILRVATAPASVQAAIVANEISAGHARALLALSEEAIEAALLQIKEQGLNVRQTEALVARLQAAANAAPTAAEEAAIPPDQAQVAHLENRFRTALGTRVNLNRSANGSGRLVIHFYNDEDLENLYQLIIGDEEI